MILMPEDGHFFCREPKCDFATCNLFEFLEHCGVEYSWNVRLNKRFSFDLFEFLGILQELIEENDIEAIHDHVQSATLLMVNASGDDLNDFIEEAVVQTEMDDIMQGIEGILREND